MTKVTPFLIELCSEDAYRLGWLPVVLSRPAVQPLHLCRWLQAVPADQDFPVRLRHQKYRSLLEYLAVRVVRCHLWDPSLLADPNGLALLENPSMTIALAPNEPTTSWIAVPTYPGTLFSSLSGRSGVTLQKKAFLGHSEFLGAVWNGSEITNILCHPCRQGFLVARGCPCLPSLRGDQDNQEIRELLVCPSRPEVQPNQLLREDLRSLWDPRGLRDRWPLVIPAVLAHLSDPDRPFHRRIPCHPWRLSRPVDLGCLDLLWVRVHQGNQPVPEIVIIIIMTVCCSIIFLITVSISHFLNRYYHLPAVRWDQCVL